MTTKVDIPHIIILLFFLTGILPEEVILFIDVIILIIYNRKFKLKKAAIYLISFLFIHGIINVLLYNTTLILMSKQLIGIGINAVFYSSLLEEKEISSVIRLYINGAKYLSIFIIIQYVAYVLNIKFIYDLRWLVYEQLEPVTQGVYRASAIYREPSQCALILCPFVFLSIYSLIGRHRGCLKYRINKGVCVLGLVGIILTFSSIGYIGLVISAIIIISEYGINYKTVVLLLGIILLLFIMFQFIPLFRERIIDIFCLLSENGSDFNNYNISSQTLIVNLKVAVKSFVDTFGFGAGIGSHPISYDKYIDDLGFSDIMFQLNKEDANSLLVRIISELGVIGVLIVLWFVFANYNKICRSNNFESRIVGGMCLAYIAMRLMRFGHYFNDGMWMFIWIFVLIAKSKNFSMFVNNEKIYINKRIKRMR